MTHTSFFRLLSHEEKGAVLAEAVAAAREGKAVPGIVHSVDPASFRQIMGAPFAYWVSERVRRLFTELPPFEGDGRTVKQGLATADDFRFVRAWWEVPPHKILTGTPDTSPEDFRRMTFRSKRWVPYPKGGRYSPYYADLHLVVNWERDGEEIKNRINPASRLPYSNVWQLTGTQQHYFFRPGLTYPRRLHKMAIAPLPRGSIISVRGSGIYGAEVELSGIAGLFSSAPFDFLVKTMLGRYAHPQFDNGTLCRTPVPPSFAESGPLAQHAMACISLRRTLDAANEMSHVFHCPAVLQVVGETLVKRGLAWEERVAQLEEQLTQHQRSIDDIAFDLYAIEPADRRTIEDSLRTPDKAEPDESENETSEEEEAESEQQVDARHLVIGLTSYAVGCTLGRWDVRLATGERPAPQLPDPFAPLPICSPGMLTGPDGLALRDAPPEYPLRIDPDGILVDDPGWDGQSPHQDDIVRRVREVLEILWRQRAEATEKEACDLLGVKDLREYFRNPRGFFEDHIGRYSMSRRKAPIYWLLQSGKSSFGVWLYYHRLDKDTLFKAIQHYVEPKIRGEMARLRELTAQLDAGKDILARREVTRLEKAIDRQQDLLTELTAFKDAIQRVAEMGYDPDLDDGVVLNIAPLHQVVPWKEARKYWDDLCAGKYPWSTMAQQLRARGLVRSEGPS